ncbi:uncharacterized protein FFUJ_05408 [Fusarium fujikuroi IMI 58289]|uniref:Uncharacterized protein n=1 Tax=Gibberella fujikuroi (strain CBS 195.34 / IMI 58289 / NRRL A-6831) TaxID=1279085 RepID=S0E465_GIBF5|nr:uncharacterized protein FFUJ_05408 [Fusarium fujikuroi IMI 58289]QGI82591.1 hypothetical protein CEK25_009320 [Fusarium fujikuroi]QGI96225.1 hypothetical protein CEK26_009294 [Fusarium fujikuroi]CCT69516.1 uncharacterized protein FFUJ_05408 [Fusarium fujikuroi IMI 58289]
MDLDIHTVKRAEGFLNATEDKNGSCISDDPAEDQLKEMHERPSVRDRPWPLDLLFENSPTRFLSDG